MYFIGAGISRIFYKQEKHERKDHQINYKNTYWIKNKHKYDKDSFERMF